MPKPRNPWMHDDLMERRVSFKNTRTGGQPQRKINFKHFEEFSNEFGFSGSNNYQPVRKNNNNMRRMGGKGKGHMGMGRPSSPAPKKRWFESPLNWYRVQIPYGSKYDKPFLLRKILDHINPLPLIPYLWETQGRQATFYIDEHKTAEKLSTMNKEIEMPDGFKLLIRVQADTPHIELNPELREKMKQVMAKRYNPVTKALDMTKFHADPDLHDTFCPLFRPTVNQAAINIISENIPEIEALNLNDNNIQVIAHLKDIIKKLPNLKIFHIGKNKLKSMHNLDVLTGVPLVELVLDGNPLCDGFKDQTTYISDVRKRFPKLLKLDGVELAPPISFDIEESTLPPPKQTYLCNPGQDIVRQFLEQYIEITDSDNRQPLLQAYHENAMFSLTMSYGYGDAQKNTCNWYNTDNRNLYRVSDPERRRKLLKQGNLAVVAFLQEMPQTKHDLNSLTVDLTLFTPQMMIISIAGVFKEVRTGRKQSPIRSFFRTFVIVPSGTGFCIVNEELHITKATDAQIENAFKTPPVQATSSASTSTASPIVAPAVPMIDDMRKQQMLQALSLETGMNIEWSQKCLEETSWDYPRAQFAFTEAKTNGAIPAEAFVK